MSKIDIKGCQQKYCCDKELTSLPVIREKVAKWTFSDQGSSEFAKIANSYDIVPRTVIYCVEYISTYICEKNMH